MPDYSYVLDEMGFSYSSASSFETCAYGFKLNYIDGEERIGNWYADYGLLIHKTLEKYFNGELDRIWLSDYFVDNYSFVVMSDPPPFPAGIEDKYYQDALDFFENLPINRDDYEIISIEDKTETTYKGVKIIVKPDLVVKEKKTGKVVIIDFKTSKPQIKGKWNFAKIEDYEKQLLLYADVLEKVLGIHIDKISLLFIRLNTVYEIDVTQEKIDKALDWFLGVVKAIQAEEDWKPTVNKFFCSQLCGVRKSCEFWGNDND